MLRSSDSPACKDFAPKCQKPPLGVKPGWLVREERAMDLAQAIHRHVVGKPYREWDASTVASWCGELFDLIIEIEKRQAEIREGAPCL